MCLRHRPPRRAWTARGRAARPARRARPPHRRRQSQHGVKAACAAASWPIAWAMARRSYWSDGRNGGAFGAEVGDAQVLADLQEHARRVGHRLTGAACAISVMAGASPSTSSRATSAARSAGMPPSPRRRASRSRSALRRGGRALSSAAVNAASPALWRAIVPARSVERRAVAQEPLRLCVHEILRGLIEAQLRLALHPAVERIDALPQLRQIEHLARRHEGVRDVRRRAARFGGEPHSHGRATAVDDRVGEAERNDLAAQAVAVDPGRDSARAAGAGNRP